LLPDAHDGVTSYVGHVYALENHGPADRDNASPRRRLDRTVQDAWDSQLRLPLALLIFQSAGAIATSAHQHGHSAHLGIVDWLLIILGPVALAFRRRHQVLVLWLALAATLTPSGSWVSNLSLIAAFFTVATSGRRPAAWTVVVVGYVCSVWLAPSAYGNPTASVEFALLLFGWLVALMISAEVVRLHRERTAQTRAVRRLDAHQKASAERLRMARDLHDAIGHTISLINVQAGVGLDLIDSQPEQARVALAAIKDVSKDALAELRTMLDALRETDEDAPRTPTPGLARLPELVELTRAAGLEVSTEISGERRPLPVAVDLAAYRIIQESLTNVVRHSQATAAVIRLKYEPDRLQIEVRDDGSADPTPMPASLGSGILGMHERAASLGGSLHAGRRSAGGFTVTAQLPVRGQP
jgi:signal transduction histidine kinase